MSNNFEPINPSEVILDDEPINPSEVILDRNSIYMTTPEDLRRVRMAFTTNDPLGFISDSDERCYVQSVTENLPDRDEYRKRLALAAFFTANNKKANYRFVLGNLDGILEQFYKKKTTIDAAFADIAQMYNPTRTTTAAEFGKMVVEGGKSYSAAAGAGLVDFAKNAAATHLRLGVWSLGIAEKILSPVLTEEQKNLYKFFQNVGRGVGEKWVIKGNEEISQGLAESAGMNENFVTDMIKGDFDKVSVHDFTKALIQSVPSMAFQLGLAAVTPWAAPAFIGTQTAAMKDYEVDRKQPDWGMVRHLAYVGLSAASEALLEIVTSKIARGALSRKAAAEIVSKGLLKYIGGSFSKEAATEAGQQIASNAIDLFYDIEGDAGRLSGGQFMARLFKGVPEAGFIGGVWGVPYGIAGFKNSREMMGAAEEVKASHRAKVKELSAKESLTDAEKKQLETSQEILENNSPQEILALDHVSKTVEEANTDEQLRNTEEFNELLEKSAPGTTEEEIFDAVRAQRNLAFKATAEYDLDDVYNKVSEIAADFPGVEFVTVDSWADLPDDLRTLSRNRGRGFYNPADGKVYINASRVRPHDVLELMLHEAVGHKGLQAVVPKAQLDVMLDKVYAAHFKDEDFQKIAARYFPDSIQRLVDEDGEEYFAPSLETPAQQREAAEEYIAHIAQKGVPKPGWWKEFLMQIRMFFRKFKWADDAVMLDSQIETVLARAARKVRRAVVKENLTTETEGYGKVRSGTGEVRYSVTEENGLERTETDEIKNLKRQLQGTKQWMKAPDGTKTNLTESQWLQVRTESFKKWFGDWELVALLNNAKKAWNDKGFTFTYRFSPSVELKQRLEDLLGHTVNILQIDGSTVRHIKNEHSDIKSETKKGQKARTAEDIVLIPYLLNNFDEAELSPKHDDNLGNRAITITKQINGVSVIGTIERGKNGVYVVTNWQTVSAVQMQTTPGRNALSDADKSKIQQDIAKIKTGAENFSKIVDENGEPLVVYHGTTKYGFYVFRDDSFFTPDKNYAARYANHNDKNIYAVYLSIQNPFDIRNLQDRKIFTEYRNGHAPAETKTGAMDWAEYDYEDFRSYLQENFPGKYDGIIIDEGGDTAEKSRGLSYIPFFSTQIKSATDNIGTFDPENPDIRFSLEEYSESDQDDILAVLRPFVGRNIDMDDAVYKNYLREKGINISDNDAELFFRMAVMENSKAARERGIRARESWIFENFPLFAEVAEFAGGSDFKIKPVGHEGEDFTGSFISPEYVKYSIKESQGKRSDKQYKRYIDTRLDKLSSAPGFPIDEVASAVARKLGQDPDAVKEQILDFFRHLKKKDLYASYSQFKKDALTLDKEAERQAREEFMQQEKYRIEDEAIGILTAGEALDREWIAENPKVFKEIYKRIFDGKEPASTVSNIDVEAVNAALTQDQSTESFGPGYKEGKRAAEKEFREKLKNEREKLKQEREKAYEEYQDKLRALRDQVLSDKADAVKLQKEAASFAAKHLPYKNRGEFIRRIIQLLEMPSSPSARFPEGRRKDAFDKLLAQITERAAEVRKDDFLRRLENRLQQLGERVDSGRKVRGVRDMATQEKINRIIQITHLDGASINAEITAAQQKIEALIEEGKSTADLEYDIALLNRYGELWNKSADEVTLAFTELQKLAKTGRDNLLDAINARDAEDGIDRQELWSAVNGGIKYSSTELKRQEDRRNLSRDVVKLLDKSFWPTLSLDGMLDAMALFSNKENVVDRFRRLAHRAKLDKDSRNMQNSEECRSFLKKIIKTDSSIAVAETIGKWRQIQKQSGVRRFVPDPDEPQFKYERIPVDQARLLLSQYDAGRNNMPDYEAEAIRQQLAGIDRKIKYDVPEEFRDGFTDKLVDLIKKEMAEGKEPTVVVPHPTFKGATEELELSQLQALYLKLMWDQKDVRYKMRYNGYSDETMAQLDKFLLPEVKELGKWMVQQLENDREDIEKVYKQMYFANFPKEENYFPSVYRVTGNSIKASAVDLTQEGSAAGAVAYTPGALKVRVYHLKDIDVADALTVFQNHRLLMNHFVTHAEPARKLRSVLLNSDVKQAIEGVHGKTAYSEMKQALKDFINGGNADVAANDLASHVYSAAVRTKMAFNLVSGLKQTLGALTYLQEIPAKSFMKGFAYAAAHPKEVIDTLADTDYYKARWNSGANSELRLILDKAGRQTSKAAQIFNRIDEAGSIPLRFGDAVSVLFGGFSVYKYHYDNLIKQGMDKAEARKEALLKWEMATERTQQSNAPFLLNRFQRGNYMSRTFTTFMSNQILLWNHNAAALYKSLKYGSNAPLKDFRMGMAALVLSSAAMTAFDQLKEHWDDGEYEWMNLFWNNLADMVSGFGPIGSIISSGIQAYKPGGFPISPIWSDLFRGGDTIVKQIQEGELTIFENDWSDAVKILQSAGYLFRPAAQAGAVGREIRKWYKILNE